MAKPCFGCDLEEKLHNCCSAHPETGESVLRKFPDGRVRYACPELSPRGLCKAYEDAPAACYAQQCPDFAGMDLVSLMSR
jgi:hypothetical protein